MTGLPKKALDLLELGRSHGWAVDTQPLEVEILGLGEAHGLGFLRTLEDGRDLYLASVEGALGTCSAEELGETGYAELRALRQAIAHLEEVLR